MNEERTERRGGFLTVLLFIILVGAIVLVALRVVGKSDGNIVISESEWTSLQNDVIALRQEVEQLTDIIENPKTQPKKEPAPTPKPEPVPTPKPTQNDITLSSYSHEWGNVNARL